MGNFLFACNAVLPIILLIMLGYYLRQKGLYNDAFLKYGNKFVFQIALPSLLFFNVYSIQSIKEVKWSVVLFVCAVITVIFLAGLGCTVQFTKDPAKRGVLLQCIFRSNFAIIGIPLAESIGGGGSVETASIISAFSIPLYNVLAVFSLTMFQTDETGKKISMKEVGKKIAQNPLIHGVGLGLLCLVIRGLIPQNEQTGNAAFSMKQNLPFLYTAIKNVGSIASPLALIILGGNFHFQAIRRLAKDIVFGTAWRVLITPLAALSCAVLLSVHTSLFDFTSAEYSAFIALFASPVAVSSAIMAAEMGGDEELAGQLVVWTSICSVFTIFAAIVILKTVNVI